MNQSVVHVVRGGAEAASAAHIALALGLCKGVHGAATNEEEDQEDACGGHPCTAPGRAVGPSDGTVPLTLGFDKMGPLFAKSLCCNKHCSRQNKQVTGNKEDTGKTKDESTGASGRGEMTTLLRAPAFPPRAHGTYSRNRL